ncbi:MAG: FtsX-like permease family protein [Archangiaceae bacterium]|nr:FtsX-like permease family protein [Archangiaceae bacterium]
MSTTALQIEVAPVERTSPKKVVAQPIALVSPHSWATMARLGWSMLFHDRLKLAGTLVGVVFAVLLSNFQVGIYFSLLLRNTMFVERAGADLWITPPGTVALQGGDGTVPDSVVAVARAVPGVEWSAPLLMGAASVKLPEGGQKPVMLVGTELPALRGGPFNVVAGTPAALAMRDAVFFEGSRRELLGGLNLGSVREVNGHRAQAVGFTSGLLPFGPSYAFASFDTARELLHRSNHELSYAMVGLSPGADVRAVQERLRAQFPSQEVLTLAELKQRTIGQVLRESGIGKSIGSGVAMSVLCGFVIVALTMFSAVIDRVRQFGTLKALGATNLDLARLLLVQAITCAVIGVLLGETLVAWFLRAIREAEQPLTLPPWLMVATLAGMTVMCMLASSLALLRVRRVEPAMVFRG